MRVDVAMTDADIRWDLDDVGPWRESESVINAALAALSTITDDLAAALIVELLHTIADLRERGPSIEQLASAGLAEWHERYRADLRRQRMRERHCNERQKVATS